MALVKYNVYLTISHIDRHTRTYSSNILYKMCCRIFCIKRKHVHTHNEQKCFLSLSFFVTLGSHSFISTPNPHDSFLHFPLCFARTFSVITKYCKLTFIYHMWNVMQCLFWNTDATWTKTKKITENWRKGETKKTPTTSMVFLSDIAVQTSSALELIETFGAVTEKRVEWNPIKIGWTDVLVFASHFSCINQIWMNFPVYTILRSIAFFGKTLLPIIDLRALALAAAAADGGGTHFYSLLMLKNGVSIYE